MSLDNIQLPPQLVREFFKKSLIASKTENSRASVSPETAAPSSAERPVESAPVPPKKIDPAPPAAEMPRAEEPVTMPESIPPVNFLGKNQRQIAILVHNPQDRHLPDGQLGFLMKLLGACQLTIADVAVVNIAHDAGFNHLYFQQAVPAQSIISFGVKPAQLKLPLDFPAYQLQRFQQQTYLHAPSLTELENDKDEKLKLWTALKTLFQL